MRGRQPTRDTNDGLVVSSSSSPPPSRQGMIQCITMPTSKGAMEVTAPHHLSDRQTVAC
jgi:hypothetical protein